jgi:hypothetical protein
MDQLRSELVAAGIDSAELEFQVQNGVIFPIVKSARISRAIESVARADPSDIQQVAASQLEMSNSYYFSALTQARRSFMAAIIAGGIGLAFFLIAVAYALTRETIGAAAVPMLSGAVVEVIAGLNFWLFGKTSRQLDAFHVRLEQTQRYLLANSVCANLSDESRDAARTELVRLIATNAITSTNDAGAAVAISA